MMNTSFIEYEITLKDGRKVKLYASKDTDHGAIRQIMSDSKSVLEYDEHKVRLGKDRSSFHSGLDTCPNCEEEGTELEYMPCCNTLICWDFCLAEEPEECPSCGTPMSVTLKHPYTKEAYVTIYSVKRSTIA